MDSTSMLVGKYVCMYGHYFKHQYHPHPNYPVHHPVNE